MDIKVIVRRAHMVVTEAKKLYIKWTRGKNSIDSKKVDVTPETPLCQFEGGGTFKISASFYLTGEN